VYRSVSRQTRWRSEEGRRGTCHVCDGSSLTEVNAICRFVEDGLDGETDRVAIMEALDVARQPVAVALANVNEVAYAEPAANCVERPPVAKRGGSQANPRSPAAGSYFVPSLGCEAANPARRRATLRPTTLQDHLADAFKLAERRA
jgi:hypothetical protein